MAMSFVLAALVAAAAPQGETVVSEQEARQLAQIARSGSGEGVVMARKLKGKKLAAALEAALAGQTRLVHVPDLGIYAIYTAPGGALYAWFPGQPAVIGGKWGVQRFSSKLSSACFRYRRATGWTDGPFVPGECVSPDVTLGQADVLGRWGGDVFGLSSGRVPFIKAQWGMPKP